MQESNRFVASLFPEGGPKLLNLKFFPGEEQVTVEMFCEMAHSVFLLADTGQSEGKDDFPEQLTRVPVDRFMSVS